MNVLLHTIALEPARWTAQRVSQPLRQLLPRIAAYGFHQIEIFEPHLSEEAEWPEIRRTLAALEMEPAILSSYLNLTPAVTSDQELETKLATFGRCLDAFEFKKVRLFPGAAALMADAEGLRVYAERLQYVRAQWPKVELLLETHDGSLADDPRFLAQFVTELALPKLGLLYQPTFFEPEGALEQFRIQRPLIRHVHLQNRNPDLSFASLENGVIPWQKILRNLDTTVDLTLEFVPLGICSVENFDLEAVLAQASEEANYARRVAAD